MLPTLPSVFTAESLPLLAIGPSPLPDGGADVPPSGALFADGVVLRLPQAARVNVSIKAKIKMNAALDGFFMITYLDLFKDSRGRVLFISMNGLHFTL